MKRGWIVMAAVVFATQAVGRQAPAQSAPAWDQGFNPTVDEVEVKQGDTLWDISARIVGDPFLWPKVWSLNPEITNPHWIYPGDRVRFVEAELDLPSQAELVGGEGPGEGWSETPAGGDLGTEQATATLERDDALTRQDSGPRIEVITTTPSQRTRRLGDRHLWRFATSKDIKESGVLTNASPDKVLLTDGDQVYLKFPTASRPKRGQRLMVFRNLNEITHPDSGAAQGFVTQVTGVLVVESVPEEPTTRARVLFAVHDMERGQRVVLMEEDPHLKPVRVATDKKIRGTVIAVRDGDNMVAGTDELVYIDRGKSHGLARGNQLRVFGNGDMLLAPGERGMRIEVGRLHVIDARDSASTCLVIRAIREIEPGAEVETIITRPRGGG